MPINRISGTFTSPKVDVVVDMGDPFLNLTIDGFLKIGTVAAARVAAEETYYFAKRGNGECWIQIFELMSFIKDVVAFEINEYAKVQLQS